MIFVSIYVPESVTIEVQSPSEFKVNVGEELRLFVEASCAAGGQIFYQWFCGSKKLSYGKSNELYVKRVRLEDQGTYSCQVRSEHGGSALSNATQVIGECGGVGVGIGGSGLWP